jgi:hypothetical protein
MSRACALGQLIRESNEDLVLRGSSSTVPLTTGTGLGPYEISG